MSQFHCGLFHLHTRPIVSQSNCVPGPLWPSIVSQFCYIPVAWCPNSTVSSPIMSLSHCVPVPSLGLKASIAEGEWNTWGLLQCGAGTHRDCPLPEITTFQVHHLCVVRPVGHLALSQQVLVGVKIPGDGERGDTVPLAVCTVGLSEWFSFSLAETWITLLFGSLIVGGGGGGAKSQNSVQIPQLCLWACNPSFTL